MMLSFHHLNNNFLPRLTLPPVQDRSIRIFLIIVQEIQVLHSLFDIFVNGNDLEFPFRFWIEADDIFDCACMGCEHFAVVGRYGDFFEVYWHFFWIIK